MSLQAIPAEGGKKSASAQAKGKSYGSNMSDSNGSFLPVENGLLENTVTKWDKMYEYKKNIWFNKAKSGRIQRLWRQHLNKKWGNLLNLRQKCIFQIHAKGEGKPHKNNQRPLDVWRLSVTLLKTEWIQNESFGENLYRIWKE